MSRAKLTDQDIYEDIFKRITEKPEEMIRNLRKYFLLTQKSLSRQLNINYATVNSHENGVNKPFPVVVKNYALFFAARFENEAQYKNFLDKSDKKD